MTSVHNPNRSRLAWLAAALLAGCSASTLPDALVFGADCGAPAAVCESGQCLEVDSATHVCTQSCTKTSDCPSSAICDHSAKLGKVCVPVGLGGRCGKDGDCPA